jgi:Icc-related predicted phosphoesterase
MSDLHLEFGEGPTLNGNADVLILAGDINTGSNVDWVNEQALKYEHIIYVPGNHEYYHGRINAVDEALKSKVAHNVHVLQNDYVTLSGIQFIGCTLWSDIEAGGPIAVINAGRMNDYNYIEAVEGVILTPADTIEIHKKSVKYLYDNMKPGAVVITHHAPSIKSIVDKYRRSSVNHCYYSDLSFLIECYRPKFWFHGHVHDTVNYKLHGCRVKSNPRGYVGHATNYLFNPNKTVKVHTW